ncbi:MAG TPA: flagellar hook-length control protein FliK [Pseudobacteroides sp.]|uniref:flagellar hook-length control protein FliK n=1 Tax=Pseudobacteroides sp. TaxID=1968840 RepID=UPI002F947E13
MITQNLMLGFMQKTQVFPAGSKAALSDEKAAPTIQKASFEREAFDIQLKAAENRRNLNRNQAEARESIKRNSPRFNSFKEALRNDQKPEMNSTKESKKVNDDIDREDGMNGENNKKVKKPASLEISQEEIAVAQVLGMQPEEFRKIMEDINIEPQDFQDEAKIPAIIEGIAQKLGLNVEQKNALKELVEGVVKLVDLKSADGSVVLEDLQNDDIRKMNTDELKAGGSNAKEVNNIKEESKTSLEELAEKLKEKIEELTQKLKENPEAMKEELTKVVRSMMDKYSSKASMQGNTESEMVMDSEEETVESQPINMGKITEAGDAKKEASQNSENLRDPRANSKEENVKASENQGAGKNQEQVYLKSSKEDLSIESKADVKGISSNLQSVPAEQGNLNKSAGDVEALKTIKDQPVSKRDILTQVIDKAKVVFNGDKSEMVISMRPENLGKLSLKVVTEHGIITAKFIAESQQVKEVLESNMQLLKDTLEKQGISIQGFSVSVDSNPSREFSGQKDYNQGAKENNSKGKPIGFNTVSTMEAASNVEKVNPYIMGESRINLTA